MVVVEGTDTAAVELAHAVEVHAELVGYRNNREGTDFILRLLAMTEIRQAGLCSVGLTKTLDSMITLTTFHGEIRIAQLSKVESINKHFERVD